MSKIKVVNRKVFEYDGRTLLQIDESGHINIIAGSISNDEAREIARILTEHLLEGR